MAELRHRKCGGIISIDIASQFSLKTHSILITPNEVKLGVLELTVGNKESRPIFVCNKCDARLEITEEQEDVTAMCLVCSRQKPITQLWTSYHFPCICTGCKDEMFGRGKREKSRLVEVLNLSNSDITFVEFTKVLNRPIS